MIVRAPRRIAVRAVSLLALVCGACDPEPDPRAGWHFEFGSSVDVLERINAVERSSRPAFALETELIIGHEGAPETRFGSRVKVAIDAAGSAYVLDIDSQLIRVFGPEGDLERTIGHPGQGPGELENASALMLVDGRLAVADASVGGLKVFELSGEFVGVDPAAQFFMDLYALGGESYAALEYDSNSARPVASKWTLETSGSERIATFEPVTPYVVRAMMPEPRLRVGGAAMMYLTGSREYEVLAANLESGESWALRVVSDRHRVLGNDREQAIDRRKRVGRAVADDASITRFTWPEFFPVIANISADASGRLYVFPFAIDVDDGFPVDVYSSSADLLFSGMAPVQGWDLVAGDAVYRVEEDNETAELRLVRYRFQALPPVEVVEN